LRIIGATVLLGDDVLDLKWQIVVLLRHLAVLAPCVGAFVDQNSGGVFHAD